MAARATATITINDAAIKGLLARVGQGMFDGVSKASELIRDEAKALAPVDTGALRESITSDVQRGIRSITGNRSGAMSDTAFAVSGTVAPHVMYAAYVEFGTGQRGQASAGAGDGPYNPNWKGQPAQPYMRSSFDANANRAVDLITEAVQDSLK